METKLKTDFCIARVCAGVECACVHLNVLVMSRVVVLRDDKMAAQKDTKIGENGRYRRRRRIINLATSRIS